mgnify:CR=1 FL=1
MRLYDTEISRLLRAFSFRPEREIEAMIQQQMERPEPWRLQKRLADEMTTLVHGEGGLEEAKRITTALFTKDLNVLGALSAKELTEVFDGAPVLELEFVPGSFTVLELALKTGCFDSNCKCLIV